MNRGLFLFLWMMFFSIVGLKAQVIEIPTAVESAFKEKYPGAIQVEWKENAGSFEAGFSLDDEQWIATFSDKGEWKESEKMIAFDDLPEDVQDSFDESKYGEWKPGNVSLIEKDKKVRYKIYAEKNSLPQKVFLLFSEKGRLMKEMQGI